eukprot:g6174.t1
MASEPKTVAERLSSLSMVNPAIVEIFVMMPTEEKWFSTIFPLTLTANIINDDEANVKLWTINEDTAEYEYDVKFLPFFIEEGENASYGVRLDTSPNSTVKVEPAIQLTNAQTILEPYPVLKVVPLALEFDFTNWNVTQRLTVHSVPDKIDHNAVRFRILHNITTTDNVLLNKATAQPMLVDVRVNDDDTAGIDVADKKALTLKENGPTESITILKLNSQPVFDVTIMVDIPSPLVKASVPSFYISKNAWNSVSQTIAFQALAGVPSDSIKIHLRPVSDDPKYNGATVAIDATLVPSGVAPSRPFVTHESQQRLRISWSHANTQFEVQWSEQDTFANANTTTTNASEMFIHTKTPLALAVVYVRVRAAEGPWSPISEKWVTAGTCDIVNQYLSTANTLYAWKCQQCPDGAYCQGDDVTWSKVKAMTGYWRVPNRAIFVKCLNPCSCLGAPNPLISCPEALQHNPEGCNTAQGFRQGSRMCADCLPGYSRDGRGGCKKCGEKGLNVLFPILVGCMILLVLFLLVYSTVVKRGGAFESSDGARKIFISYLQLSSLATTMKIAWPVDYMTLFRIEGMLSSVGEEMLDIRCALEQPIPIATIEYYKTVAYAFVPFVLVFLSVLGWSTCGRVVARPKRRAMMVGTIVLLLYLAYPSISAGVLGLWKCEYVESVGYIFVVDPETLCSDVSHRQWLNLLGWPCILLYVIGLPAAGLVQLYRFRNKLDEPRTRIRFGQLYDGFTRENYLYEGWVTLRKVLIIIIGNFTVKLQVHLAIGSVVLLLGHTIYRQPYQTRNLTHLDTLLLSCVFFTYWVGSIFGVYPQCHSNEWEAEVCKAGQWVVFLFNIACSAIGFGMCIWLTWIEEREQLTGSAKGLCAAISRWRIFRPCCRKGLGIWLRASQAEWSTNPLDREVELKAIVRSIMVGSPEEMIGILKGEVKTLREKDTKLERENKTLREKDTKLEKENKTLREENKRLKAGKTETWEELQDEEGRGISLQS